MAEVGAPPPTTQAAGTAGPADQPADPVQSAVDAAKATLAEHKNGDQIIEDLTKQIPGLLANLDLGQADSVLNGIATAVPPELRDGLQTHLHVAAQQMGTLATITGQAAQAFSGDYSTQLQNQAHQEQMTAVHLNTLQVLLSLQGA